jgi:hypothetical protein
MYADKFRLTNRVKFLTLAPCRTKPANVWLQRLRLSRLKRALDRSEDPNVEQALFAISFGMFVSLDAVREVHQFAAELVGGPEALLGFLF